jgi:two-component system response regulator YesN
MYKLILADDEQEARKGIIEKIAWSELGFEVAGEAENGREAYDLAEITVPDIVITDIRMPFMDGLELAAALKNRFPTIRIIILTAYDEFEYAQRAIKIDIAEYVLKPVSSNELIEVLLKVKHEIDNEKAQRENNQILLEQFKRALPVLKEKYLSSVITGSVPGEQISIRASELGLDLNGKQFVVAVVGLDQTCFTIGNDNQLMGLYDKKNIRYVEDLALPNMAVFNLCMEIAAKDSLAIPFLHNDCVCLILAYKTNDIQGFVESTFKILDEIRLTIEKFLNFTVTIGLGSFCDEIAMISKSYKNAVSALEYRLIHGCNRIIFIEDIECLHMDKLIFDDHDERALTSSIKLGDDNEVKFIIDALFENVNKAKASFKDFQIFLMEILIVIIKSSKSHDIEMDRIFGSNRNLFVEMYKFRDINEAKEWLIGICSEVMKRIRAEKGNTCRHLVKKAKEFIHENYYDNDLTIEKVAKHIHISPSYFSAIFKKETKETFVNYLVNVRMTEAKLLLRTTEMKTLEIAERVGYLEPSYFSYVFKKHCGISPSLYRNSHLTAKMQQVIK